MRARTLDTALDFALTYNGVNIHYGLDGRECTDRKGVLLCKLHGSLHWRESNPDGQIEASDVDYSSFELSDPQIDEAKTIHLCHELLWRDTSSEGSTENYLPFIIPPTDNKLSLHNKIKPVWRCAARALRNAEAVIVIGYSLPATDQFFRKFFALSTIGRTDLEHFWVVDPDEHVADKFRSILNPELSDHLHHQQGTFTEMENEIADFLGEHMWK